MDLSSKVKLVVNDILKPSEDKRSYRGIELHNGLKALLISDPNTDKSSAALDVNIGHMSDPEDIPGLAHFCEHMLFLGTTKYPEENDYNKFLSEHGGSSNAYTSAENTNYYFDVSPDYLKDALDRFSQFFVSPLFTESATSRELNAVNSENDKNLQNDSWRIHQLEKSTCSPHHAFSKFGTGNKETLEVIPKKLGLDLRRELLKFHDEYYSSNIMSLAVLGKESLDELANMVTHLFASVKNKDVVTPEWLDHPLSPKELKKRLNVVPIKDLRMLNICWPIPDLHKHYKTNPGHYIGHLIGHEGPGSLLSELKKRGLVNNLMAGENTGAKGFMFFNVNVDLTEEGIDNVDTVVTLVFQYLNMLRREGPKQWVFKECQELSEMAFRFKDKERPSNYTCKLAFALQMFPIKEVLSGPYLYDEYKPELIYMVLDKLTPDNTRLYVVGKKFESHMNLAEKWYGTSYSLESISEETIEVVDDEYKSMIKVKWRESGLNECFRLPDINDFISTNFDIIPKTPESPLLPVIIQENSMSRLWYCQDDVFKLPKACFTVQLNSPTAFANPLSTDLTHLYIELLKDMLNEYTYAAELAGIRYDLSNNTYGIQFNIAGYNDKQQNLLKKVVEKMLNFEIDEQRFGILKENYIRSLKNFRAEQPHQHASHYTGMLISEVHWTKEELLEAAEDMTTSRLTSFLPQLFSQMFMECLVYGNVSKEKAKMMLELLEKPLVEKYSIRPLLPSQHKRFRQVQLPDGCCYQYRRENDVHKSSSLEIYYQCNLQDTHSNMLLELFCQIISEPCFDILRTQEQLGYIVFSGIRRSHGVQGLRIIVQSDKSPSYVEQRVELFVMNMKNYIENMDDGVFDKHINALASKRLEKPKKLTSQNNKYWNEIANQFYNFERDEIEVEHLKTLTKCDVLAYYQELLAHDAPKRHKLTVHVVSTASPSPVALDGTSVASPLKAVINNEIHDDKESEDVNAVNKLQDVKLNEISDITSFKRQLGLFPLPMPVLPINKSKL